MAFAFVGPKEEDTPHCKVFMVSSIEGDPVGTTLLYDWVTTGDMGILDMVPEVCLVHEVSTQSISVCTVALDISISAPTRRSITLTKTSLDPGPSVIKHYFRITLLGKRAIEV